MASGSWSWWGSSATAGATEFDRIVEKCTSENLPSSTPPSIADSLELSDLLRSSGVTPTHALRSLRRRLTHTNPNVSLLAISVLDICVKNGGDAFLREVGGRDFSDEVAGLVRSGTTNREVKDKLKRELQNWALAFEAVPSLSGTELVNQYHRLKHQGIEFPPKDPSATAAMVDSMSAPEWRDNEVCERCRTAFSFTNRKHHCRNCGGVFDNQCSTKRRTLPHFGITSEPVRVCDGCDRQLAAGGGKGRRNSVAGDMPASPRSSGGVARSSTYGGGGRSSYHRSPLKSSRADRSSRQEDDDLARAIALSLQESGPSSSSRPGYTPAYVNGPSRPPDPPVRKSSIAKSPIKEEEDDPDLAAAIAASLREVEAPRPSAPVGVGDNQKGPPKRPPLPSYDLTPAETDAILSFGGDIEAAQLSGRLDPRDRMATARYADMHDRAMQARPQLLRGLGDADRKILLLQEMNDKVSQSVKMYDRLLEEQLAFRTQSPVYQRPQSAYTPYQTAPSAAPHGYQTSTPYYANPSQPYGPPQPPHPTSPRVASAQFAPLPPAEGATPHHPYAPQPSQLLSSSQAHTAAPSLYEPWQPYPNAPAHPSQPAYSPSLQHQPQFQAFPPTAATERPAYESAPVLYAPSAASAPPAPAPEISSAPSAPSAPGPAPHRPTAVAPQPTEPSYYKVPYNHYTSESFPSAPQTEPAPPVAATENPWTTQRDGYAFERQVEAAPLIEL